MKDKAVLLPMLAVLIALTGTSCLRIGAKTPAASPALAVPTPPSRTLLPAPVQPDEPVPPPPSSAATAPAPRPAEPPPAARTTPPPAAPSTTPPATPVVEAPPVVQAAANMSALENKVNDTLRAAEVQLKGLNASQLSREAQDQLTTAWSHIRTSREALGYKNFVYAFELAEKALTLAKQLVK